jgi:hypothetical protein
MISIPFLLFPLLMPRPCPGSATLRVLIDPAQERKVQRMEEEWPNGFLKARPLSSCWEAFKNARH